MIRRRTIVLGAASAAALAAGFTAAALWGSSPTAPSAARPVVGSASVVAPTTSPTPKPTTAAGAEARAGDTFATDPGALPDGLLSFELGDGTWVAVDPAAPVPEPVVADLAAVAAAGAQAAGGSLAGLAAAFGSLDDRALAGTGRGVVVVFPMAAQDPDGEDAAPAWAFWGRAGSSSYRSAPAPLEQTQAAAAAWAADQTGVSYTVVVAR